MERPVYQGAYSRRFSNYIASEKAGKSNPKAALFSLNVRSGDPTMGEASVTHIPSSSFGSEGLGQQGDRGGAVSGERYRATAKPFKGYRFLRWEGDLVGVDATSNPIDFTVTKDTRLVARFSKAPNSVAVNTVNVMWPANLGRVNGNGLEFGKVGRAVLKASPGSSVKLTATPLAGYRFAGWRGGPVDGNISSTVTFTVKSDCTIQAHFAAVGSDTPTVGVDPATGGDEPATGGGEPATGGDEPTSVSSDTTGKVKSFVKKWWWALAIVAYVIYKEKKGGAK